MSHDFRTNHQFADDILKFKGIKIEGRDREGTWSAEVLHLLYLYLPPLTPLPIPIL